MFSIFFYTHHLPGSYSWSLDLQHKPVESYPTNLGLSKKKKRLNSNDNVSKQMNNEFVTGNADIIDLNILCERVKSNNSYANIHTQMHKFRWS